MDGRLSASNDKTGPKPHFHAPSSMDGAARESTRPHDGDGFGAGIFPV
jgi:hypothetical protein